MRALFGEGLHPDADTLAGRRCVRRRRVGGGGVQATRLGRRFPQYRPRPAMRPAGSARRTRQREAAAGSAVDRAGEADGPPGGCRRASSSRGPAGRRWIRSSWSRSATGSARREAVAGYDLTFTPVKSVAVLWGLGSEATRQQIFDAHEAAVADCAGLAGDACRVHPDRGPRAGPDQHTGVIAAQFHHWDSRAGDPDLHTHVAISNKVQGPDGKWRSLDGRHAVRGGGVGLGAVQHPDRGRAPHPARRRVHRTRQPRRGRPPAGPGDRRRAAADLLSAFSKRRQGIEQQYQELLARLPAPPWPRPGEADPARASTSRPP